MLYLSRDPFCVFIAMIDNNNNCFGGRGLTAVSFINSPMCAENNIGDALAVCGAGVYLLSSVASLPRCISLYGGGGVRHSPTRSETNEIALLRCLARLSLSDGVVFGGEAVIVNSNTFPTVM